MPDGPVVLNNTPLVALWAIDRLDLLRGLFSEVLIPESVAAAAVVSIDRLLDSIMPLSLSIESGPVTIASGMTPIVRGSVTIAREALTID